MILTTNQQKGLKLAVQRYQNGEKYTVISGYAGTGKSTLVRFIIDALDVEEKRVCYAAYTGKAAEVLRKKGCRNVCTLHRLLYDHFPKPTGGFFRKPKLVIDYDIVIVDEVSMAPKNLMELLLGHNCYIICLGDPFQLPPIDKDEDNHLLDHPHVFLDEIMRQEEDNEIIQLTMKIRNQEPIDYYNGENVKILPKEQLNTGMLLWADQILTATNSHRIEINNQMRDLLGRGPKPEDGDKVICLRNYWDDVSINGDPLVNGTIGILKDSFSTFRNIPRFIKSNIKKFDILQGDFVVDTDIYKNLEMDNKMILTGEKCCDWKLAYQLGKLRNTYGEIVPREFTYAYAVTTHKAQGSEWDKVLVLEENFPFDRTEHARWLYTATTRAADRLVLVR